MSDPVRDEWRSEDGSVRLLLGDSAEIELELWRYDTILTDPPYGIACIRRGIKYTGIEITPEHFETAKRRIQAEFDYPLIDEAAKERQLTFV